MRYGACRSRDKRVTPHSSGRCRDRVGQWINCQLPQRRWQYVNLLTRLRVLIPPVSSRTRDFRRLTVPFVEVGTVNLLLLNRLPNAMPTSPLLGENSQLLGKSFRLTVAYSCRGLN